MRRTKPITTCTRYVRSFDEELRAFVTKDRRGAARVIQFVDGPRRHPESERRSSRLAELLDPVLKRNGLTGGFSELWRQVELYQGGAAGPQLLGPRPERSPLTLAYVGEARSSGLWTGHLVQSVDGLCLDSRGLTISLGGHGPLAIRVELCEQVHVPPIPEERVATIIRYLHLNSPRRFEGSRLPALFKKLGIQGDSSGFFVDQIQDRETLGSARFFYYSTAAEERRADGPTHFLALDLDLFGPETGRLRATLDITSNRLVAFTTRHANLSLKGKVWEFDPVSVTGDLSLRSDQWGTKSDIVSAYDGALRDRILEHGSEKLSGDYVKVEGELSETASLDTFSFKTSGGQGDSELLKKKVQDFLKFSAYYHGTRVFEKIDRLTGSVKEYFTSTASAKEELEFPVHLKFSDEWPNASADLLQPDVTTLQDGSTSIRRIGCISFPSLGSSGLKQLIANCAADCRAHWHEVSHLALELHTGQWDLLRCVHSVGDSLAILHCDPHLSESARENRNIRYVYAPFGAQSPGRRHDRKKPWDSHENHAENSSYHHLYDHEELLTSCHFRLYRALGGDSPYLRDRVRASDRVMRMILSAIPILFEQIGGAVTKGFADVADAILCWKEACVTADNGSLLLFPAGYPRASAERLIRWAFESQGGLSIAESVAVSLRPVDEPFKRFGYDARSWLGGGAFLAETDSACTIWPPAKPQQGARAGGSLGELPQTFNSKAQGGLDPLFVNVYSFGVEAAEAVYVEIYESEPIIGLCWSSKELTRIATTQRMTILPDHEVANVAVGLPPTDPHKFLYVVARCEGDPPALAGGDPLPLSAGLDDNVAMRCVVTVELSGTELGVLNEQIGKVGARVFNYTGNTVSTKALTLRVEHPGLSWCEVEWGSATPSDIPDGESAPFHLKLTSVPWDQENVDIDVVVLIDLIDPDADGEIADPPDDDRLMFYGGMTFRLLLT